MSIDISEMTLVADYINLDPDDHEFIKLTKEAKSFLESHKWCKKVEEQWLANVWDNLVAIFFFKISPGSKNVDNYVWIVVGDIPPAYIDIESAKNELEVIQAYIEIMNDWVGCVQSGKPVDDCYPINVPATVEYAEMLSTRLKLIEEHILKME